jgi:DNA-binding transcriptional MerR regulator
MDAKEKYKVQLAEGQALIKTLQEAGKSPEEIHAIISKKGYTSPVLSKLFHMSGKKLTPGTKTADQKLAEQTIEERKDARKPIREKEIEDASWFHNLLHDLGKYVYHAMVQYVKWTPEDMNNYEHARKTVTDYIDSIQKLIQDAGQIDQLEDANAVLEMNLTRCQKFLDMAVARVKMLKWYNDMLISVMPPDVRLRALNQMMAASAISVMPEGMAQAEVEANVNVQ